MSFLTWIRLATHRVVNDCDLRRSSLTHQRYLNCGRLHMHVSDAYVCGISGRNSFKEGRV